MIATTCFCAIKNNKAIRLVAVARAQRHHSSSVGVGKVDPNDSGRRSGGDNIMRALSFRIEPAKEVLADC